ncbi:hypothetical protein NS331_02075 [Pseudacidovorax intermedius]|uniref:Uncharacterized protein n=1 Tax=Pseudacidovorax intermedius TaxID=433924 RepID=A0A147HBU7_9BURK|nr:hypothetical protein NS331_02075 [Pseudacidovorax intermedius]
MPLCQVSLVTSGNEPSGAPLVPWEESLGSGMAASRKAASLACRGGRKGGLMSMGVLRPSEERR